MEINNNLSSSSSIYMQLAQNRAQLANIDKQEQTKSTQDSYDKLNESSTKYNQQDYQVIQGRSKNIDDQSETSETSSSPNELSSADAQITRSANLNKMLLQSMG